MISSVEAALCKKDGKKLYEELEKKFGPGKLNGVGISLSKDKQHAAIHLLLVDKTIIDQIPTVFNGHEVNVSVTGIIRPLEES